MSIYILRLEENKYYVGSVVNIHNVHGAISLHLQGLGSPWTAQHKVLEIMETIPQGTIADEHRYTIEYMKKYGYKNVRGAEYCNIKLNTKEITAIKNEINPKKRAGSKYPRRFKVDRFSLAKNNKIKKPSITCQAVCHEGKNKGFKCPSKGIFIYNGQYYCGRHKNKVSLPNSDKYYNCAKCGGNHYESNCINFNSEDQAKCPNCSGNHLSINCNGSGKFAKINIIHTTDIKCQAICKYGRKKGLQCPYNATYTYADRHYCGLHYTCAYNSSYNVSDNVSDNLEQDINNFIN